MISILASLFLEHSVYILSYYVVPKSHELLLLFLGAWHWFILSMSAVRSSDQWSRICSEGSCSDIAVCHTSFMGTAFLLVLMFLISSILHHHPALLHHHALILGRLLIFFVAFFTLFSKLSFSQSLFLHSRLSLPQADLLE